MVGRAAIQPRPQEAHQHNLPNSGPLRRLNDIPGGFNVNLLKGLLAYLAVDSGAVGDGVATGKSIRKDCGIGKIARDESRRRASG